MKYIVSQDWESESFLYLEEEYEVMMNDITEWLFNNDENRSDCIEKHPEKHLDDDWNYRVFCENLAEDTVDSAEIYGKWGVADLTVRAL